MEREVSPPPELQRLNLLSRQWLQQQDVSERVRLFVFSQFKLIILTDLAAEDNLILGKFATYIKTYKHFIVFKLKVQLL